MELDETPAWTSQNFGEFLEHDASRFRVLSQPIFQHIIDSDKEFADESDESNFQCNDRGSEAFSDCLSVISSSDPEREGLGVDITQTTTTQQGGVESGNGPLFFGNDHMDASAFDFSNGQVKITFETTNHTAKVN